MAQNKPDFRFKITPGRFIWYLWLTRMNIIRTHTDGICCALNFAVHQDRRYKVPTGMNRNEYALNVSRIMYYLVQGMDEGLKYSYNYLFRPYDWKKRDQFLDQFIQALCDRYNIPHPSKS